MIKKLISNIFLSKKYILKWNFYFFPLEVRIEENYGKDLEEDKAKIIGFVHFLYRYLYICDERASIPVMAYFLARFKYGKENANPYTFYENLLNVFSESEIKSITSYFSQFNSFFPVPPLKMVKENNDGKRFALYTFNIHLNRNRFFNYFKMSLSPDKVLLPILIVVLYDYINDSLSDKYKGVLNEIIKEVITDPDLKEFRSSNSLINKPNIILNSKGIGN